MEKAAKEKTVYETEVFKAGELLKEIKKSIKAGDPMVVGFYSEDHIGSTIYVAEAGKTAMHKYDFDFSPINIENKKLSSLAEHFKVKSYPSLLVFNEGKAIGCIAGEKTPVQCNFLLSQIIDKNKEIDLDKLPKEKTVLYKPSEKKAGELTQDELLHIYLHGENDKELYRGVLLTLAGLVVVTSGAGLAMTALGAGLTGFGAVSTIRPINILSNKVIEKLADNYKHLSYGFGKKAEMAEENITRLEKKYYPMTINKAYPPIKQLAVNVAQLVAGAAMIVSTGGASLLAYGFSTVLAFDVSSDIGENIKYSVASIKERIKEKIEDRKTKRQIAKVSAELKKIINPKNNNSEMTEIQIDKAAKLLKSLFESEVAPSKKTKLFSKISNKFNSISKKIKDKSNKIKPNKKNDFKL